MIRIRKVDYLSDYKLTLTFTDKKVKVIDLKKYSNAKPETVFYPFKDKDFFKAVKVDKHTGTIVWPNGVDLCPDVLYKEGKEVKGVAKKPSTKRQVKPSPSTSAKPRTSIAAKARH